VELWPWLEANHTRRFFAYAHYREPHFPYDAPPAFIARFGPDAPLPAAAKTDENFISSVNWRGRTLSPEEQDHLVRLYDANLAYVDAEVGALRRRLEELGAWQRTLVIVTADHGEALYEHGPFVGHNEQLYEPSVRIPLIIRFPGGPGPAGVRIGGLVDTTDLAPTIAEAFGLPSSASVGFGGRSLLAVVGGAPGKPAVVSRTVGERPRYMLREERFKYMVDTQLGREQLFDLEADAEERNDLGPARPTLLAACRQRLAAWLVALRRARGEALGEDALTPEQRENLRALGYIQ
jgi:arylsulfatase A-like enzyme